MRTEFSKATRLKAWQRCGGLCENCNARLWPGKFQYDHAKMDTFGGEAVLENCRVLCSNCHTKKTGQEAKVVAKSNRIRAKHLGLKPKRSGFRGWRKFNGDLVWRQSKKES